jgi:hypothetical protein
MIVAACISAGCALLAILLLVSSLLKSWSADLIFFIIIIFVPLVIMRVRGARGSALYCRLILGTCATLGVSLLFLVIVGGALTVGLSYLIPPVLIGYCLAVTSLTSAYVFVRRVDRWQWLTVPFSFISLFLFALVLRATKEI